MCAAVTDLQYVAPDIVSEGPPQTMQNVQHLFLLQHREKAVQKDLEPDRNGLGAVQHQTADVKHHIGLYDLHLGWVVKMLGAELIQSCENDQVARGGREEKKHTKTHRGAKLVTIKFLSHLKSSFIGSCTVSIGWQHVSQTELVVLMSLSSILLT